MTYVLAELHIIRRINFPNWERSKKYLWHIKYVLEKNRYLCVFSVCVSVQNMLIYVVIHSMSLEFPFPAFTKYTDTFAFHLKTHSHPIPLSTTHDRCPIQEKMCIQHTLNISTSTLLWFFLFLFQHVGF